MSWELVVALASLAIAIVAWRWPRSPKSDERSKEEIGLPKEEQRQIITEYYPDLIADFKTDWDALDKYFLQGRYSHGFFEVLDELEHSSELKRIQSIDERLYDNLIRAHDEVIPRFTRLNEVRIKARNDVSEAWRGYVESWAHKLRQENVEFFTRELINRLYWLLAGSNFDRARTECQTVIQQTTVFKSHASKAGIPEDFFDMLVKLFEEEWRRVEDEFKQFKDEYDNLIRVSIINYMSEALKI